MHITVILIGVALMAYFLLFSPPKFLLQEPISDTADMLIGVAVSVVWLLMFILLAALWYSQYPDPDFGKPTSHGGAYWGPIILMVLAGIPSILFGLVLHARVTAKQPLQGTVK